jgi:uncharacterized membrane protein YidH (DUF202 family)
MNEAAEDLSISIATSVASIRSLLDRAVSLQEIETELARERSTTSAALLEHVATTSGHTRHQTDLAEQRTELTREQNRLSARSNELAGVRTELAQERTALAQERIDLSAQQTDLAQTRTGLSQRRTALAEDRNHLATTRTVLSRMRTELARGRTALALIRTGLAFLTLGVGLFRLFGPSLWSIFDAALVMGSLIVTTVGIRNYLAVMRATARLEKALDSSG